MENVYKLTAVLPVNDTRGSFSSFAIMFLWEVKTALSFIKHLDKLKRTARVITKQTMQS